MPLDLIAVLAAGLVTLATPCVLPMLPVYLSMLVGAGLDQARHGRARTRLVGATLLFVAGFSIVFTGLGLAASSVGAVLAAHRSTLLILGGLLIALFGAKYLGLLRLPWLDGSLRLETRMVARTPLGAFVFGIVFALGWTPCVGPILGTVLTYTATNTSSPWLGALYLFTYSLGVGLPLLIVSLAAERLLPLVRRLHRHLPLVERATGAVMVAVGLWLSIPGLISSATAATRAPAGPHAVDGAPLTLAPGEPSERPRIIEYTSESCPVCLRMRPRIQQLRDDCLAHRVEIVEVSVSDPRNAELVASRGLHAVPVLELFAADGTPVARLHGERSVAELRAAAAELVASSCGGVAPGAAPEPESGQASGAACATGGEAATSTNSAALVEAESAAVACTEPVEAPVP